MSTVNVTIRMDDELKAEADEVLSEMGMSFTTAVNVFMRQVVRERRIPFEISAGPAAGGPDKAAVRASERFALKYGEDFKKMAE